jgi:hypothetical protein
LPSTDTVLNSQLDTFIISKDGIDEIIEYKSDDSIYFDLANKKAYLYGNAVVVYGELNLKSELIVIDFDKRELYAKGRVDSLGKYVGRPVFKDDERETEADTMIYNFDSKRGRTYGISMKENDGYIYCNKVFRDKDKSIYSDEGRYTTCNNILHPHFYLKTSNLKIIPQKKIIFGPSYLVIEGIPTPLALPFGMMPTNTERKSGLIPFEYGMSGNYGPFLRNVGFHWAISDKFDQSFSGDVYFRGSWRIASNSRYAKRYKFNGNLNIEFSKYLNGEREDPDFKTNVTNAARFMWQHYQDPKARPGSTFNAKVDIQKNRASQLNSFNPSAIISNEFTSSISYSKFLIPNKLELRTSATHRQNTQTRDFSLSLPSIALNMQRITPFSKPDKFGKYKWYKNVGISYIFDMENRIDTKDSIFFSGKPLEGFIPGFSINSPLILKPSDNFKQGIIHSIPITLGSYKFLKNYFTLNPNVNYREYWYFETIDKVWNPDLKKVDTIYNQGFSRASDYSASFSINTNVFATLQLQGKKIQAIRHTLTPIIGYSYRPDYGQEKFGYYKDFQYDSAGNTRKYSIYEQGIKRGPQNGKSGLITFALNNILQAKVLKKTDSTAKYVNASWIENISINGSYNTLADSQKLSNISVSGFTKLFNQVSLNANANLNPYAKNGEVYGKKYQFLTDRRIGTWTNATVQLTTSINADMFRKKKSLDTTGLINSQEDVNNYNDMLYNPAGYVNFDMPWSLNVNYSLTYSRLNYVTRYNQTFSIGGDFNVSPKWKVGASSGYDFFEKKIAYTQFDISRLLHCWALNFSWIPDGVRKSFIFSLKVNSSILQSLKVDKKRYWFDQ